MQITNHHNYAITLANQMVSERFSGPHGTTTWPEYCDFAHTRATAHLSPHVAQRIDRRSAGKQRRNIKLTIDKNGVLIAAVPMNDPRANSMVHAKVEFGVLLDLNECGADGSWVLNYKSKTQRAGQVRMKAAFSGGSGPNLVTVARIIANAKHGQQARLKDHNSLNLRRSNIYIVGNPATPEGRVGTAKTDTRSQIKKAAEHRASLTGLSYGHADQ